MKLYLQQKNMKKRENNKFDEEQIAHDSQAPCCSQETSSVQTSKENLNGNSDDTTGISVDSDKIEENLDEYNVQK